MDEMKLKELENLIKSLSSLKDCIDSCIVSYEQYELIIDSYLNLERLLLFSQNRQESVFSKDLNNK